MFAVWIVGTAMASGIAVGAVRARDRRLGLLREVAVVLGGTFERGLGFRRWRVVGTLDWLGWTVECDGWGGRAGRQPVVVVRVRQGTGWSARREGPLDDVAKRLGVDDTRLDDPDFDQEVHLDGDTAHAIATLTADHRMALRVWVGMGGVVDRDEVRLELADGGLDAAAVATRVRDAVSLARALQRPQSVRAALLARLEDDDPPIQIRAAMALGSALPESAIAPITRLAWERIESERSSPVALALLATLEPRDERVSARVVPLLEHPDRRVGIAAAQTLARVGTVAAIAALRDTRPGVLGDGARRAAVDDAIDAIQGALGDVGEGRLSIAPDDRADGRVSLSSEGGAAAPPDDPSARDDGPAR